MHAKVRKRKRKRRIRMMRFQCLVQKSLNPAHGRSHRWRRQRQRGRGAQKRRQRARERARVNRRRKRQRRSRLTRKHVGRRMRARKRNPRLPPRLPPKGSPKRNQIKRVGKKLLLQKGIDQPPPTQVRSLMLVVTPTTSTCVSTSLGILGVRTGSEFHLKR